MKNQGTSFWECDSENGHRVALDSQSLQYSYVSVGQLIHHVAFERLDVGVLATSQPLYTTDVHVFSLPFPPCEFLS
jgi:hypothetical protein